MASERRSWRPALMSCVLITLAAFAACADLDTGFDPAFGLGDEVVAVPTFSGDVQPILTRRCVVGGCHTLASAQGGLSLDPSDSYESLVNVPSLLHEGLDRVEPFDPGASWLVRMIEADPAGRDGRPRMPLASSPLTPNQIATIVNWIERGAPND